MSSLLGTRPSSKPARPFSCSLVSLTIAINDTRYSVDGTDAGEFGTKSYRLTKHSARDGGTYDVVRTHAGIVECDCPDYESRHRGNGYGMCKHGRGLVELGLLAAPIAAAVLPVVQMIAEPCCDPGEPLPCQACIAPPAAELAPASADPAEGDANLWGPETDEVWTATWDDVWTITEPEPVPDGDDDHLLNTADDWHAPFAVAPYEPTEQDRQDSAEIFGAMEAQAHLDRSDRLTLAELADRQTDFYRSWGNEAGKMFADAMESLALKIRMTEATTPAELEARSDALDLAARETWEAIGYDSAKRECQCED